MVEKNAFLANQKHQYRLAQRGKHDCSANNKKNRDIISIQVCLISRMNFDYEENGVKKSFLVNPKH